MSRSIALHILSLAVDIKLKIHKMDMSTEFLIASLEDDIIYVKKALGHEDIVPSVQPLRLLKEL